MNDVQGPVLTALLSPRLSLWLLSWSPSLSCLVFLFPCCLLRSQHYCLSQRTLSSQEVSEAAQLPSVLLPLPCFGVICSETHFFIFLAVQGLRRALPQHHLAHGPFSHQPPHCLTLTPARGKWGEEGGMVSTLDISRPHLILVT